MTSMPKLQLIEAIKGELMLAELFRPRRDQGNDCLRASRLVS